MSKYILRRIRIGYGLKNIQNEMSKFPAIRHYCNSVIHSYQTGSRAILYYHFSLVLEETLIVSPSVIIIIQRPRTRSKAICAVYTMYINIISSYV